MLNLNALVDLKKTYEIWKTKPWAVVPLDLWKISNSFPCCPEDQGLARQLSPQTQYFQSPPHWKPQELPLYSKTQSLLQTSKC